MDHKNLEYFMKAQKLNQKQVRWALYSSRFDSTLKHVLGIRMGKADGLSKRLDLKVEVENGNKNQKWIKEEWVRRMGKRNDGSSGERTRNRIGGKNKKSKRKR